MRIKFNLGGLADGRISNMVAKMDQNSFDDNEWTKVGSLLSGRVIHRSIVLGNRIFHIGGMGTKWVIKLKIIFLSNLFFRNFEEWKWEENQFDKKEFGQTLTDYGYPIYGYPEAFVVNANYCA